MLHRTGSRVRSGPFLAIVGPRCAAPAVAFAIRTEVGSAVLRNRLRRRLRGLLEERVEHLPSAAMIVRPSPLAGALSYPRLAVAVDRLVADLASGSAIPQASSPIREVASA